MNRRGFLTSILALAAAPAIVRADSLMRIVPRGNVLTKAYLDALVNHMSLHHIPPGPDDCYYAYVHRESPLVQTVTFPRALLFKGNEELVVSHSQLGAFESYKRIAVSRTANGWRTSDARLTQA